MKMRLSFLLTTGAVAFSVPASNGAATRAAAQDLKKWVELEGGSAKNVVAGPTKHGVGLLAAEGIKMGDPAVSIPRQCVLTVPDETSGLAMQALSQAVPEEFWAGRLALALLAARSAGEGARMACYLRTLPAAYTVPLFWTPEAIGLLQYPTVQAQLLKTAKFVQSFAAEHLGEASKPEFSGLSVTSDAFGWAVATCTSRASSVGGERVLCPIIDLGNHAPSGEANCEVRGDALSGRVQLVALRDIALGEEVTYCYGSLSNDVFLLDYGFLPGEGSVPNAHDDCTLSWAEGELLATACGAAGMKGLGSNLADWQVAALRSALPRGLASIRITRDGVEPVALTACRVAVAADAQALRKVDGGRRPLPGAGEVRALKIAAAMCAIALSGFPEPGEADAAAAEESAAAATWDGGVGLARRFLHEKRSVCSDALGRLGERIKAIQSGESKAELRGITKGKQASGVRKQSARKGGAKAGRPSAGGFGSK